jgi:cell division septation protein DedD
MDDDFNAEELRPGFYRDDTELTLGPAVMVGIAIGMLSLCGLCIWLGYWLGSRGVHNAPVVALQPAVPAAAPVASSTAKPAAAPKKSLQRQAAEAGLSGDTESRSSFGANSAPPVVQYALSDRVTAGAPVPVPAPALSLMVQIAAVSQQEDADVLEAALRRRGYAVLVRHDPADSKFHVQVGPFTSRGDADTMRQKLVNDGYNAIVGP